MKIIIIKIKIINIKAVKKDQGVGELFCCNIITAAVAVVNDQELCF